MQIVMDLCDVNEGLAEETLQSCGWKVKIAVLMIKNVISKEYAEEILQKNKGVLRKALNYGKG